MKPLLRARWADAYAVLGALAVGCNSTLDLGSNPRVVLPPTSPVVLPRDGAPVTFFIAVKGASPDAKLDVSPLPPGVTKTVTRVTAGGAGQSVAPAGAQAWSVTLREDPTQMVPPGDVAPTVHAELSDGSFAVVADVPMTSAVVAAVGSEPDATLGVNGHFAQFMSTSFQPAPWQYQFFELNPDLTDLENLNSHHIHIQAFDQAIPWKKKSTPPSPDDWDFSELDAVVRNIVSVADVSPLFQIAVPPPFIGPYVEDTNIGPANLADFQDYCVNLVRYYGGGGFTYGGATFRPNFPSRITWWSILGDFNVNNLSVTNYGKVYAQVVPAMLAVDPNLKFSAFEYSDYTSNHRSGPVGDLSTFLGAIGPASPFDVISLHAFSTANIADPDSTVFDAVPNFAKDIREVAAALKSAASPGSPPARVWVTQNNVNSDVPTATGMSQNLPSNTFKNDPRGTSMFFAGWRPYVFSQFGKAGAGGLYHWDYTAGHSTGPSLDPQSAEVTYDAGVKLPSYWVDYWLGRMYPWSETGPYPEILTVEGASDHALGVEVLATRTEDSAVLVMVADVAPLASDPKSNDGPGDPRTVVVDTSALPPFTNASLWILDGQHDLSANQPPDHPAVAGRMVVHLAGYGAAFLKLTP